MAGKTAVELTHISKLPKIPEGCEVIQSERTLSGVKHTTKGEDGKDKTVSPKSVVSVVVPKEGDKQGLINWIEYRSKVGGALAKGELGTHDTINAIRSESFNIVPKLTEETVKVSTEYLLPFSGPRTIDPFEAQTAWVANFMRDKNRIPSADEYKEFMDSLIQGG
jgi:hypothetical protein